MKRVEGSLWAAGLTVALLVSRWNALVVERLVEGAAESFRQHGGQAERLWRIDVPGSFELPLAAQRVAAGGRASAIVALGAVIRGGTDHYTHVASAAISGLAQAGLQAGIPIALGVLTTDTLEQALERAGGKAGNKGSEAMLAAIEMANLLAALGGQP